MLIEGLRIILQLACTGQIDLSTWLTAEQIEFINLQLKERYTNTEDIERQIAALEEQKAAIQSLNQPEE
jgi:hypothetical protein